MSLRQKAVTGLAWSAIDKWGQQAISFLVFLVLSRLMEPEAFGLVALATVFTSYVRVFVDQGMGQAIVQRAELDPEHLHTAFWFNVLMGTLLTVAGILLSGWVANLFDEPRLAPVLAWLSLTFLLFSLSSTQQAILERQLDFKRLSIRSLVAVISGGIVGVGAALLGFGVWSLVFQILINRLVGTLMLWGVSDWRPKFRFSIAHIKDLFGFSLNVLALRVVFLLSGRLDNLLIGYFLGATALGYYFVAQRLLQAIDNLITGVTSVVTFSSFSRLQWQPARLRQALNRATQYTSLIAFPLFLGIAMLAPELVSVLFGDKWLPAVPVMQILALGGLVNSLHNFNFTLLSALGKPFWALVLIILSTPVIVIGFILAVPWGIAAIAAVIVGVKILFAPPTLLLVDRLIQLDFRIYFKQFVPPLAASLAMSAVLLGLRRITDNALAADATLVVFGLVGALVYVFVLHLVNPALRGQLVDLAHLLLPESLFSRVDLPKSKPRE